MKINLLHSASKYLRKPNSFGFSLLEMLIVTTLTVLIVVTGTSLFLTTILGGGRANTTTIVKNNGDYALGQMEYLLRNAIELLPTDVADPSSDCYLNMPAIRFKLIDQGETTLFAENEKIASNSGVYLTSDEVSVVGSPSFDCTRSADEAITSVRISFTLRRGEVGLDRQSETEEQTFSTIVNMRTFR